MTNKFRSPVNNVRFLKQLFFEMTLADKPYVLYTLKDVDHEGYPSLYRLYMETDDPTEYEFANTYLDGWEHWEMLCATEWFKPYVTRWRKELDLRMKSKALKALKAEKDNLDSRTRITVNKYLLERGWEPKENPKNSKTKASQEEVLQHVASMEKKELDEAAERIGLRMN